MNTPPGEAWGVKGVWWGAGVGSTFIVQLPVHAGAKVEPQITLTCSRAQSVTFNGADAEVSPPFALPVNVCQQANVCRVDLPLIQDCVLVPQMFT